MCIAYCGVINYPIDEYKLYTILLMNINWCLYGNEHFLRKILVTILMKLYQISGWRERLKPQQLQSLTQSDLELSQQAWVLSTLCIRFCPVLFTEVFRPPILTVDSLPVVRTLEFLPSLSLLSSGRDDVAKMSFVADKRKVLLKQGKFHTKNNNKNMITRHKAWTFGMLFITVRWSRN